MHVFDSSVWIYAITQTCDEAIELIDGVLDGRIRTAVDAYIFNEVIDRIERSGTDSRAIDEAQTHFAEIVHDCPYIDGPDYDRIGQLQLETIRSDDRTQLLGRTWNIQPKDVPIVVLADNQPTTPTIIFTADSDFSEFEPTSYDIDGIALQYVDCS